MKVIINQTTYDNVLWDENTLTMETSMTLAQIESAFIPSQSVDIIVKEGTEEIARYYNKGISSITVSGDNPRTVVVVFDVTQISENAETEIRESLEDSDGAILELAEMVSEISETMETIEHFNDRAGQIEHDLQVINRAIQSILERIDKLEPHDIVSESTEEEEENND